MARQFGLIHPLLVMERYLEKYFIVHRLAYQVQAMDSNRKAQILSE
jgi:hypothetical protein